MASRKCPECGVTVKLQNLERHVRGVHPQRSASFVLSEEERRAVHRSVRARGRRFPARRVAVAALLFSILAVGLAFGLPRLPALPHPGGMVLHWHPTLRISIDGQAMTIPGQIGIDPALWDDHSLDEYGMQATPEMGMGGMAPLHTHDTSGTIHVESTVVRDYTLGEFFRVWGQTFDGEQVLGHAAGAGHRVWMLVDGAERGPTYSLVLLNKMNIEIVCDAGLIESAGPAPTGPQPAA